MSLARVWLVVLACCAASACRATSFVDLATDPTPDAGKGTPEAGAGGTDTTEPLDASTSPLPEASMPDPFVPVARCGDRPCACDDGQDNDGDGLIDGFDPECTGALDEDEATFATGRETKMKECRDCFWDEDPGRGNDACRYPAQCLRGESINRPGNCGSCTVAEACVDTCEERTPNGCDCFGCCDVWSATGATISVLLTESCSLARIDDTEACPRCVQSTQCQNPCGPCELCPGKTQSDLPAHCRTGQAPNRCDPLVTVCASSADCGIDQYCQLGCCFTLLL